MRLALPDERMTGVGRRISVAVALSNDDGTVDVVSTNGGEELENVPISMLEPMLPFEHSGISDGGTAALPPLEAAAELKDRAGQLFRLKAFQDAAALYLTAVQRITQDISPVSLLTVGSAVLVQWPLDASSAQLTVRPATVAIQGDGTADVLFEDGTPSLPEDEDDVPEHRMTGVPLGGASSSTAAAALLRTLLLNHVRCVIAEAPLRNDRKGMLEEALFSVDCALALGILLHKVGKRAAAKQGGEKKRVGGPFFCEGGAAALTPAQRREAEGTAWFLRARVFGLQRSWGRARASAARAKALLPEGKGPSVERFLAELERKSTSAKRADRQLARELAKYVQSIGSGSSEGGAGGAASGGKEGW